MEPTITNPIVIEKESISTLHYPKTEVLKTIQEEKIRAHELQSAIRLGNTQKRKVKIVFEDNQGLKQIETTVWAVTEKNILLKGGMFIPIIRIHRISAY